MLIAVTTPTGNVGRHVTALLLRAGLRPRLLVRDPDRLDGDVRSAADVVQVDQRDGDAVVEATAGVDGLFWVSPQVDREDPIAGYTQLGQNVARAVTHNAIPRTVFQSSVGAEKRQGAGEIDGLARTEELLDATGRNVLHLRCGYFFTNLLFELDAIRAGVIPIVLPVDHPLAWVAPRDIAEVAVTRLLAGDVVGQQVQAVHGPMDLSWRQVADIISDATGISVRAEQIADEQMRGMLSSAGFGAKAIDALIAMSTGLRDGFTAEQRRTVRTSTPTRLGGWAFDQLRPLLSRQ
ncbi:NmrA family NAD(P)-binding protein [Nakamurella sp. GG22]